MFSKEIILPKEIPGTEESGRLQSVASQELDTTWRLNHTTAKETSGLCPQLLGGNPCTLDHPV